MGNWETDSLYDFDNQHYANNKVDGIFSGIFPDPNNILVPSALIQQVIKQHESCPTLEEIKTFQQLIIEAFVDGQLTFEDLAAAGANVFGVNYFTEQDRAELASMWKSADKDKDGSWSIDEFEPVVRAAAASYAEYCVRRDELTLLGCSEDDGCE